MFHSNFHSQSSSSSESDSDNFYSADEDFDSEDGISDVESMSSQDSTSLEMGVTPYLWEPEIENVADDIHLQPSVIENEKTKNLALKESAILVGVNVHTAVRWIAQSIPFAVKKYQVYLRIISKVKVGFSSPRQMGRLFC